MCILQDNDEKQDVELQFLSDGQATAALATPGPNITKKYK